MRIIILGGGHVGSALAEQLVNEQNDITLVDRDADCLRQLQEKFDLRVLLGHAAHPEVLREAGAQEADALVAVTSSDEVNIVACQVAYKLFKTPERIAHIRSQAYLDYQEQLFNAEATPLCQVITPAQLVADHIYQLIAYPGASRLLSCLQGKVGLLVLKADAEHPLISTPLSRLSQQMVVFDARVVALSRQKQLLMPATACTIERGDELFFIVRYEHLPVITAFWHGLDKPCKHKRVIIAGGGKIGAVLAKRLEEAYSVKLIERDPKRAEVLASMLQHTIVFCGNAADQTLLTEEHIERTDLFVAVTNYDEDNILSAMLAKHLGAKKNLVLIQHSLYADVVQQGAIDLTVSPQQVVSTALLTRLWGIKAETAVHVTQEGAAIIELCVQGDLIFSRVMGASMDQIELPAGATVVARARGDAYLITDDGTPIQAGDQLLLFTIDKKALAEVEQLFQLAQP